MARSMMLPEFSVLTEVLPPGALQREYRDAILTDNVLGKPTYASRDKSLRHLLQLYGLDPKQALFRMLRKLAAEDRTSLPLMAMTCTFCRDAQLRHSFGLIDQLKPGEPLRRERMEEYLEEGFPGRFSVATKKSLAQNVNTTWTESGHLSGRSGKVRALPQPRAAASTYAMFAGYLLGLRGEILTQSVFWKLVSPGPSVIIAHLSTATTRGWVRFRHAGGVLEIDFSAFLTRQEQEAFRGTH